jgi:parallel beta-helix repeat protein
MNNLGSVTNILYVSTAGSDATGDGTLQNPLRTISNAISLATATSGNTGILVWPGTYDTAGGEAYPLQLLPGSALACLGPNASTVLDDTGTINPAGPMVSVSIGAFAAPTYIGGCNIYTTLGWSAAVDDGGSILNVDHSFVHEPLTPICTGYTSYGIYLTGKGSSVTKTQIVANPNCYAAYNTGIWVGADASLSGNFITGAGDGIDVSAGNSIIANNTITGNRNYGISSYSTGTITIANNTITNNSYTGIWNSNGTLTIDNNTITNNGQYGIYSGSPNSTTISNNMLSGHYYGLYLYQSSGAVSGNTISNNTGYGIYAALVGSSSIHNNKLSCNALVDFYLTDTNAANFDITNNAWDHDTISVPVSGPTITTDSPTFCSGGVDICYAAALTSAPTYSPFNVAVPGGCPN